MTRRRALIIALTVGGLTAGIDPARLPAQGAAPCCPAMPVVATSKNPAPGHAHLELQIADLESIFSNRHLLFSDADGWDAAFAALAREIDPSGQVGRTTSAVPPAVRQVPLLEGGLSDALLHPASPRHPQKGANRWANTTDPGIVMSALIDTLARINKYGEPAGGLRRASLAAARFLAGTLAQVPANAPPAVMHVRVFADRAVLSLRTPLAVVRPAQVAQRAARPPAAPAGELALDDFDRANAVLDIFDSIDEHGRRSTMELRADESNALFETLTDIASAGRRFGGAAPAGSPQDAVACRAFSALVAFANAATPASDGRRASLLNQYQFELQLMPDGKANLARLRVIRTALIMSGVASADEAEHLANALVDVGVAIGEAHPAQNAVQGDVISLVRGLSQNAGGPDRATFREVFASVLARRAEVMRERKKGVNQIGSGENGFLDALNGAPPASIVPLTAACGADPGKSKPRIYLYAVCVDGLQPIKRPYVDVPMVIEGQFDSPPSDAEIHLDVKFGGRTTTITLTRVDEKGHIYRSDPILPGKGGQQ